MTNLIPAVLFVATVGLAGCHDVRTVDPYPGNWLIDDFEDPDEVPSDHSFERWGCRPVDEEHPIDADGCNRVPDPGLHPDAGLTGNHVLHLGAALYPMKGDDTYTRSQVATYISEARLLDLRQYSSFLFGWKLVLESTAADSLMGGGPLYLKAELSCTTARNGDAAVPEKPFVVSTITIAVEPDWQWHESNLDISGFRNPENPGTGNQGNSTWEQECLSRVDGIRITLDSNRAVESNHKVKFNLYVDDISLLPKE